MIGSSTLIIYKCKRPPGHHKVVMAHLLPVGSMSWHAGFTSGLGEKWVQRNCHNQAWAKVER